jgi:hypothetical protein
VTAETATCTRCGIKRFVKRLRPDYLCQECKSVVYRNTMRTCERCGKPRRGRHLTLCSNCAHAATHIIELDGGQWVREGLVWRWHDNGQPRDDGRDEFGRFVGHTECGTDAGYSRHRRRGETICDDCRTAHRTAQRQRRKAA